MGSVKWVNFPKPWNYLMKRWKEGADLIFTHNKIINGLCKTGETAAAAGLLKKMEEAGCQPDAVTYNTIIDSLGKDRRMNEASDIFSYMKA
jgi:pentatricopeptide repeat protein